MGRIARITPLAVTLSVAASAQACLWDYDTLRDERRGLPGVAEVLAGRYERHSRFFYEERVRRMTELLAREPGNLAAMDNLAVAYEKLGDQDKAIDVMRAKEKVRPGEYTTAANLGTFYFHKGDLEGGIPHIEAALKINPDAHFGREEYQLRLAKYLLVHKGKPEGNVEDFLGISLFGPEGPDGEAGEPNRGLLYRGSPEMLREHDPKGKAVEGIVGMLRFGTGTSPDLYYALGNVLALRGDKHLAVRAYKRAIEFGHPQAKAIAELVEAVRSQIPEGDGDASDEAIARERAEAEAWLRAYQEYEDGLVRAGKDTEDEGNYAAFYEKHGRAVRPLGFAVADYLPKERQTTLLGVLVVLAVGLVTWEAVRRVRGKKEPRAEARGSEQISGL